MRSETRGHQGPDDTALADRADGDQEGAEHQADHQDDGHVTRRNGRPITAGTRDQPDGQNGQKDANYLIPLRHALREDTEQDGDGHRHHGNRRGDDAHTAAGQLLVEADEANRAQHAGDSRRQQVGRGWERFVEEESDHQQQGHAGRLRHQNHHKGVIAPRSITTAKIAGAVTDSRGEAGKYGKKSVVHFNYQ